MSLSLISQEKFLDKPMFCRLEVKHKPGVFDSYAQGIYKDILDLGFNSVSKVEVAQVYYIYGNVSEPQLEKISAQLLTDKVTEEYILSNEEQSSLNANVIEIAHKPGVMDPVEGSTLKAIKDLGIDSVESIRIAKKYSIYGQLSSKDLQLIADKILMNKLIQEVVREVPKAESASGTGAFSFKLLTVDLIKASDKQLKEISQKGQLFLNSEEMRSIQKHFKSIGRNPTDCELETIAQTWSEHCYHKTFRGDIRYEYREGKKKKVTVIKNLLKSTIMKATQTLNKKWCVSVFDDNAGVIEFDKDFHVCFKVETHNHPSALEPFGGANTGMGGVIRDILGTGLGAKPLCSTDIFCFAPPDLASSKVPAGSLHPKRVMKGVVSGVRDYGNKMGIPTVNGAIVFDERFVGNPLVFCGTVGMIPKNKVKKEARKGDYIVVMGGRTGRDGIHGATFSSGELTSESETISSGSVQIGNPIQEKRLLDCLMQARDEGLYSCITDCGAGGLSSAVGEMAKDLGAYVYLEKVPLKYQGLSYTEIWISEAQERMVVSVPPVYIPRLMEICATEDVEATVIGEFNNDHRLKLFFHDCQVCDLDMEFLHRGIPKIVKDAVWKAPVVQSIKLPNTKDFNGAILKVLSHLNVCSKEWVIRQYDHEVQGRSVIKPLTGITNDGPSDCSVITPVLGSSKGIAVANGINIRYGLVDPYWMAGSVIEEAIRQIICVGGDVERIAILDNFCWGNPDKADRLGSLVRCARGCHDFALQYGVPFISGKDSLYNEYTIGKKSLAIPGTLLVSAIGIIEDARKCVTMDLKREGNLIYCIGETLDELGGSIYADTLGFVGSNIPKVNPKVTLRIFKALTKAVQNNLLESIHDCSDGGLGVAVSEMAFSGGVGANIDLAKVPYKGKNKRDDILLFSESNGRFIVEVSRFNQRNFEKLLKNVSFGIIGVTQNLPGVQVMGLKEKIVLSLENEELKKAWQKTLNW